MKSPSAPVLKFATMIIAVLSVVSGMAKAAPALAPVSSIPGKIPLRISETAKEGGVALFLAGRAADIFVETGDFKVARIAAECLATDVMRVTGATPRVVNETRGLSRHAVLIGTLGKSPMIDELVRAGKLDVTGVAGNWESFVVATVKQPLPGVDVALVIAGADRRGTAFGVFTLSEAIGVSPWVWWADVPTPRRSALVVGDDRIVSGPPSVKYRGIFINDENWGIQPWAAKTFEPETKDIGPKTYAKVFELLLRLKANYIWPAMHGCTKAFNYYPQNKLVADDYAIVMGSSHIEQMLRSTTVEWNPKVHGSWNYTKNRERVLQFWDERVASNAKFENIYTVGMRGINDAPMVGQKNTAERIVAMEDIFVQQRAMLAKYVNLPVERVPQNLVLYTEVLNIYRKGLKVPDDITLVWPDDNHGYIRQLSSPEERKRSGASGVYYHLSYWGPPEDYLWLDSASPALIWEEMRKAYEHGADRVWVVNIGDIKPMEIGMEFFLRLAWDVASWDEKAQPVFLGDWAARTFGARHAAEIAAVLDEYYRLSFAAKPEHLKSTRFTANYGELEHRLRRYAEMVKRAEALWEAMPAEHKDSFYELVLFRVRAAALTNQLNLKTSYEERRMAYDRIQAETAYYNEKLADGKWRHMMSSNPRSRPALRAPKADAKIADAAVAGTTGEGGYVSFEAEHPARATAGAGVMWKTISGLGRSGDSIALLPTTVAPPPDAALEYAFTLEKAADAKVIVYCLPTQAIHAGTSIRYTVSIDDGEAQTFDIAASEHSKQWSQNVLRAAAIHTTTRAPLPAGKHTLKVRPLDPGLVFDKVVIDLGGLLPSHLGPPATKN